MSQADKIRQYTERQDEALVDLLLSTPECDEPRLDVGVFCPLCQGETIQITEISEGNSERCFFQMHCVDCGCDFVLFEDVIHACRRGIENAEKEIQYSKNKIEYFKGRLKNEY